MSAAASIPAIVEQPDVEQARLSERGLPLESIDELRETGLTYTEIAQVVIAPRTLKHRKARGERLSLEESDRVLRVFRTVALAKKVFGSSAKALLWLRAEDDRLDGRTPLQMLVSEPGGRAIEKAIWQVDEGVYS